MYTFICEKSVTALIGDDTVALADGKLQAQDGTEIRNCLAFIKNDAKPVIIKCWQRNSETKPEVIPVDEITDISGFDSSRVDMSYNPITEEWKDWSMTPDGQPYFDDDD